MRWIKILKLCLLTISLLLLIVHISSAERVIITVKEDDYKKDEILMKYIKILNKVNKLKSLGKIKSFKKLWIANAIAIDAPSYIIDEFKKMEDIKILKDYKIRIKTNRLSQNTNSYGKWNFEIINVSYVLSKGINGSGVNVCVIDTGVEHDELMNKVVKWIDVVNGVAEPYDDNGHGTFVCGIIASESYGISPGVNLFVAKAFDSDGVGYLSDIIYAFQWAYENGADIISYSAGTFAYDEFSSSGDLSVNDYSIIQFNVLPEYEYDGYVYDAFKPALISFNVSTNNSDFELYLMDPNGNPVELSKYDDRYIYYDRNPLMSGNWAIKIVSHSNPIRYSVYGIVVYESDGTDIISNAVNSLIDNGTIVVVAAGNEGEYGFRTINSPACSKAIAVGAIDSNKEIASFSSRGPVGWGDNLTIKPDFVAPGVNIYSTTPSGFGTMSGTSAATPHVTGVIALMLQINPRLKPEEVNDILRLTAVDLGEVGEDNVYGYGLIDAYKACKASIRGDLNDDFRIDIADVTLVAQMVVGRVKQDLSVDFNNNKRVDIGDLARMVYYYLL